MNAVAIIGHKRSSVPEFANYQQYLNELYLKHTQRAVHSSINRQGKTSDKFTAKTLTETNCWIGSTTEMKRPTSNRLAFEESTALPVVRPTVTVREQALDEEGKKPSITPPKRVFFNLSPAPQRSDRAPSQIASHQPDSEREVISRTHQNDSSRKPSARLYKPKIYPPKPPKPILKHYSVDRFSFPLPPTKTDPNLVLNARSSEDFTRYTSDDDDSDDDDDEMFLRRSFPPPKSVSSSTVVKLPKIRRTQSLTAAAPPKTYSAKRLGLHRTGSLFGCSKEFAEVMGTLNNSSESDIVQR